ncbi:lysozyme C-like [Palaemon carinicauda]|uniref:lysozyme C-like n=1 Tax=Palaemon carinicauda TaxID=392227 RepID=UPI0035B61775
MRNLLCIVILVSAVTTDTLAKRFEKCELATVLENKHKMPREEVKNWVCIAQYESTFNTEAINHANWDGSKDYGLFQLNNKYWCGEESGKNECNMPCSALLDDDLTDDLACIKKIIRDTERWKGKGTGLTAWVAYVNRCQNRNLDDYMAECWSDPIDSNIINTKDEESTQEPEESTQEQETVTENGGSNNEDSPIINLVRVPIMLQRFPYFQHLINPYGYIYQQKYQ